ncbi:MAG: purine-cytosine permease family protein [Gulosibacter sp.]|uniref:purine-cytosine permease family protein n=1 Tax=Gulosibacter sp. TaxID=2817531 RepID=UPI003F8E9ABD
MAKANTQSVRFRTSMEDDPQVLKNEQDGEYTNHVVPESARKGKAAIVGSWSAIASAMAFVYYGALGAALVGVEQAVIGMVLVVIAYSLLGSATVREAIRWGLNSTLLSRRIFGNKGAAIAPLLVGLCLFYYAVFEGSIVAVALQSFFGVWDIRIWYGIVVLGMLPLMLGGMQTWLSKLNWVSLPVYFFGVAAAVVVAGINVGWEGNWDVFPEGPDPSTGIPGWLTVFILYMGIFVLFPETQDAGRFAKKSDSKFHQHVTFGWAFYGVAYLFNGLVGIAIVGFAAHAGEITESGVVQGIIDSLGIIGLIVIIVSQVRINSANFYFSSVNFERFVGHFSKRGISRKMWVVVLSAGMFLVMLTDVFSYISAALAWQAVLIVSLIAMMITHQILNRGEEPEFRALRVKSFGPGVAVWFVSAGTGIVLLQLANVLPTASALAPLISFVLAVVLYVIVHFCKGTALRRNQDDPVREQIEDLWGTRIQCDACDLSYVAREMDVSSATNATLCLACQETEKVE